MLKNHSHCTQDEKNPDDICPDCFPYIPPFEDWWRELSSEKEIEFACDFYREKIGLLQGEKTVETELLEACKLMLNEHQRINEQLYQKIDDNTPGMALAIKAIAIAERIEQYELAKDAEDYMIDSIRECLIFEDEWTSFLKEKYKKEGGLL